MLVVAVLSSRMVSAASAQDGGTVRCDIPPSEGPQEETPADGARQVSIDAPIRVRYSRGYFEPGVGPGGDPGRMIAVRRCPTDGCSTLCRWADEPAGAFVPGRAQVLGDNLIFYADTGWAMNQAYSGMADGVDGPLYFSFCTGTEPDTTPPELGSLERVTSTPIQPRCDAPEGGYRIAAFFAPATDSIGPPASIEYLLFQTRGAGLETPVLRSTIRNFATDMHTMAFVLPPGEASEVICVRVVAVDGNGNADPSDEDASVDCIDPVQGNYFAPLCSVIGYGTRSRSLPDVMLFGVVALVLVWRRSRAAAMRRTSGVETAPAEEQ